MKQQVLFLTGLPASGKSTFAREWVAKDPTKRVRVNKDDLRAMLHVGHYSKGNEKQIISLEEQIIVSSLILGKSVVLDNTHLAKTKDGRNKHLIRITQTVENNPLLEQYQYSVLKNKIQINVKNFDVAPEECVKRDLKRLNSVGADVIWRMYWDHIVGPIKVQQRVPNLSECIIVDIDGTLAEMDGRHPFEWDKVITDKCRTHIAQLVDYYAEGFDKDVEVILMSGRDSCCREQTEQWLAKMHIGYNQLLMRPEGNMEKDTIIKERLYRENVEGKFNVALVVDDRPSVIRMWHRLGLPVVSANPVVREF